MPARSTCHTLGLMNEINKSHVEKSGVNEGMEHAHRTKKELVRTWEIWANIH